MFELVSRMKTKKLFHSGAALGDIKTSYSVKRSQKLIQNNYSIDRRKVVSGY